MKEKVRGEKKESKRFAAHLKDTLKKKQESREKVCVTGSPGPIHKQFRLSFEKLMQ